MLILILGLLLWAGGHYYKRILPEIHEQMGQKAKGLSTLLIVMGLAMMVVGYRNADFINVWYPPGWTVHLNNLLMLVAVFCLGTAHTKGRLRGWTRHPMLISVKIWAVAHLLVNGDLASIVLFGGMLLWAGVQVMLINRAAPEWERPEKGPAKKDVILVITTLVAFGVITGIHMALGVSPFPQG